MKFKSVIVILLFVFLSTGELKAQYQQRVLGEPVDISGDFAEMDNSYFLADELVNFDPATGRGQMRWQRSRLAIDMSFDNMNYSYKDVAQNEWPEIEYAANPNLPFALDFISPRTVRLRAKSGNGSFDSEPSLMLVDGYAPADSSWKYQRINGGYKYTNTGGSVTVYLKPWRIEFRDPDGKLMTKTVQKTNDLNSLSHPFPPFSYVRRANDYSRSFAATFSLSYNEKIFGCGESFTNFDKRGQKINLFTVDGMGVQRDRMYKPIPFFMSNRGYGMFIHTTTPITCDFGSKFQAVSNIFIGDRDMDIFVFMGEPKDILDEYTELTGKPTMPPLWSFGLWMSCITYSSEQETREVAQKLRANKIPSDVIHLDTGWFETDWRCDYEFSKTRFDDPKKMVSDLKDQGFHISLWQLPYFVPKNRYFNEIVEKGLYVKDAFGELPYEDAVLDFSNPDAISWYRQKIAGLLNLGVGAIKVDFGEAAPYKGIYASGKTGFYEHNLYPLRYNKIVADLTKEITGESIIWARSAWAGSQRYPLHWGGDSGNSDEAMAGSLRGGLSLGISGFTFWSNDIGGFVNSSPEELYRRWVPFGMLASHSRTHGARPREPWLFSTSFMDDFRRASELKYKLMPYVYAQSKDSVERGLPMTRALLIEFPDDPGAWLIDSQYMFGADILVAPLFEANTNSRDVYLPAGCQWVDYQTAKSYEGGRWYNITAGEIPVVMLVRSGAAIPHIKLAQTTSQMDWSDIKFETYGNQPEYHGLICLPKDNILKPVIIKK